MTSNENRRAPDATPPKRVEPREHGHLADARFIPADVTRESVLDLAHAGGADQPPEELLHALRETPLNAYPDPAAVAARTAIAARLGASADSVLVGNGASSLSWAIGRGLTRADSVVLVVLPGPVELSAAARANGARVVQWRAVERTGHAVDLEQVRELIALERPSLVSLCAPSWPSGAPVRYEALQRLAAAHPECTFMVDQHELELSEQSDELTSPPPSNAIFVRSIGTSLALNGLRVGYLWARPELCAFLDGRRPSFETSTLAQRAAELWPSQSEFIAARRSRLLAERDRLGDLLRRIGLAPTASVTGALLVRVTRATEVAAELLADFAIAVCDCTAYGLPDHLRISGVPEANAPRLEAALAQVLARRRIPGGREA
jgi:histidinol-phosphate aminotransferase